MLHTSLRLAGREGALFVRGNPDARMLYIPVLEGAVFSIRILRTLIARMTKENMSCTYHGVVA